MSTHHRQLIRKEFARLLKGQTPAGDNVTSSRSAKVWNEELRQDALSVYSLNENCETHTDSNPRRYARTLQLAVEVWSGEREIDGTLVDDQIDALCLAVEDVVEANLTLPGCEDVAINPSLSRLLRTEIDVDEDGRMLLGAARVTWEIVYYTESPPTEDATRSGQANRIGVDWNLEDSADATPEASDEITLKNP